MTICKFYYHFLLACLFNWPCFKHLHVFVLYRCGVRGAPFYVGVLVPFAVIYIFNWTIFIAIMYSLLKKAHNRLAQAKRKEVTTELKQQLRVAMMISVLFGLGWGFALLASSNVPVKAVRIVANSIFTILVGFQGFFIFMIYVVFSTNARKEWKRWLFRKDERKKKTFVSTKGNTESTNDTGTTYTNKSKAYSYGYAPSLDTSTTILNQAALVEELAIKIQQDKIKPDQICMNPLDLGDIVSSEEDDDTQSLIAEATTLCNSDSLSDNHPGEDAANQLVKDTNEQESLSETTPDDTSVSDHHSSSASEEHHLICDIELHPRPDHVSSPPTDSIQDNLSEELTQSTVGEEAALVNRYRNTS